MTLYHKWTEGAVRQTFNEKGELVRQIFIASCESDWTNESDIGIDCPNEKWYSTFDMVQPNE
jgi:hypothetical protein